MRAHSFVLLSFATLALSYKILTPNSTYGWTNSGPQPATWQRDGSDAPNFTVVLSNVDSSFYGNQVLSALVNGTPPSTTFLPPAEGWPIGDGFRLNFVKDINNLGVSYTQSDEFSIQLPSQSNSTSSMPTSSPTVVIVTPSSGNGGLTTQATDTAQATATGNHANPRNDVHAALMTVFGLVGLVLIQYLV